MEDMDEGQRETVSSIITDAVMSAISRISGRSYHSDPPPDSSGHSPIPQPRFPCSSNNYCRPTVVEMPNTRFISQIHRALNNVLFLDYLYLYLAF